MEELDYQKQLNYDSIGNQFDKITDIDDIEYQRQLDYDLIGEMVNVDDEIKDLIIDKDTVAVSIPKDSVVKFPISTDEKNMKDKKCDYKLLITLTLLSSYTSGENHRYIYKDVIIGNKDKIENYSGKKVNTVIRNVRKLSKLKGNAIIAKEVNGKIVYIINYANENGRKYVIVEEDLLRCLLDTGNSNLIKVYMLLKYRCNENTETRITRKDIAVNIGLNGDSKDNLKTISNIIVDLCNKYLIEVSRKYENKMCEDGNFKFAKYLYIKLNNYDTWKIRHEEKIKEEK